MESFTPVLYQQSGAAGACNSRVHTFIVGWQVCVLPAGSCCLHSSCVCSNSHHILWKGKLAFLLVG